MPQVKPPKHLTLAEGEAPIWYGKPTYTAYGTTILSEAIILFFGVLLVPFDFAPYLRGAVALVFALIALGIEVDVLLSVYSTEYFISDRRVITIERSFFSRSSYDLKLEQINSSELHQGALSRLGGFGNLMFICPGISAKVGMKGISDPAGVKKVVDDAIETAKKRVGTSER